MMITRLTRLAIAASLAGLLSACGFLTDNEAGNQTLAGRTWELTAFEMSHGHSDPGTTLITLQFRDDRRFEGRTTPNTYGGEYRSGPAGSLRVDPNSIVSTLVLEPEGSRSEAFFFFLARATRYKIDGDELRLYCGGDLQLRFVERRGSPI